MNATIPRQTKVLIANRGEIAVRIVRACRLMGLPSIVVFSEADRATLAVRLADEAICIGAAPVAESYLKIDRIIAAAELTGATVIHPGYGFLSENKHFAEVCRECGITFVGPSPEAIAMLGDKAMARSLMQKAGVPVVPGSTGVVAGIPEALAAAEELGFPVILKASCGGGGKGMRVAQDANALPDAFRLATAEAQTSFGNATLYLEKYLERPRHVEFQLMADAHRNIVCLGDRDCSIQRHHQKVVEESPCPALPEDLRQEMAAASVRAAEATGYLGTGTVEFLYEPTTQRYYFMEMNTRLQVEHPVTEESFGLDLVTAQLAVALGERLPWRQNDLKRRAHAIEVRINAEDPKRNFAPCPGKILFCQMPGGPGIRVDSHLYDGYVVPPYYDSLLAKIIASGETREIARRRAVQALSELVIEGIETTAPFAAGILQSSPFVKGDYHTGMIASSTLSKENTKW